jgi:hypothetical protein
MYVRFLFSWTHTFDKPIYDKLSTAKRMNLTSEDCLKNLNGLASWMSLISNNLPEDRNIPIVLGTTTTFSMLHH